METMTPDLISNVPFYSSAPRRLSMDAMCFYSTPTSPRKSFEADFDAETEPTTPQTFEDASAGFMEFEFETSRRFNLEEYDFETSRNFESSCLQKKQQYQQYYKEKESCLPSMAFADELFCDGKVMPLKPPPRLQYGENNSALSSPRSPTGLLKFSFQRRSLWNDDFDPFMVALENVKQEQREKTHRRARSMSPLRGRSPQKPEERKQSGPKSDGRRDMEINGPQPSSKWPPNQKRNMGSQEQKKPIKLIEPKGILFARRERLVKVDNEKANMRKESGGTESGEGFRESEGSRSSRRASKRQKIKKFLLRSASMGVTSNEEKQNVENEKLPGRSYARKFSFRSMRLAQYNEDKRISEVNKITLMQYRPKLLLCVGYGARHMD